RVGWSPSRRMRRWSGVSTAGRWLTWMMSLPRSVSDLTLSAAASVQASANSHRQTFIVLIVAWRRRWGGTVVTEDSRGPRGLEGLRGRAARAGLTERIEARQAQAASLGLDDLAGVVDLVWAFAVVHEIPDGRRFFREAAAALKRGGKVLLAEPRGHVKEEEFE